MNKQLFPPCLLGRLFLLFAEPALSGEGLVDLAILIVAIYIALYNESFLALGVSAEWWVSECAWKPKSK